MTHFRARFLPGGFTTCAIFSLALALIPVSGFAQKRKAKVPGLGKLAGPQHQAFSGVVKSVDMKLKVLNVAGTQGQDIEIFPVKRDTHVESAGGEKLKLSALTPGTDVLIYYDEKGGERSVKQVVVLEPGAGEGKKSNSPRS